MRISNQYEYSMQGMLATQPILIVSLSPQTALRYRMIQFFTPKSVPYVPDHLLDFAKRRLECGRGHIMKGFIERNDSGPNKLSPTYTLLPEVNSSSGRAVMYARKKAASRITSIRSSMSCARTSALPSCRWRSLASP